MERWGIIVIVTATVLMLLPVEIFADQLRGKYFLLLYFFGNHFGHGAMMRQRNVNRSRRFKNGLAKSYENNNNNLSQFYIYNNHLYSIIFHKCYRTLTSYKVKV